MKRKIVLVVLITLASTVASICYSAKSDATKSEYLKTATGGIGVEKENSLVFYGLFLDVIKPFKKDVYLKTEFENPCDQKNPLIETQIVKSTETMVTVRSGNVTCLEKGHEYLIKIKVFSDPAMKKQFSVHEQWVFSGLDDKMAAEMFHEAAMQNETGKGSKQ